MTEQVNTIDPLSNKNWPPTDKQIKILAYNAFSLMENSDDQKVKESKTVLVYWNNNPRLMIFDYFPNVLAQTDYIIKDCEFNGKKIKLRIGKED